MTDEKTPDRESDSQRARRMREEFGDSLLAAMEEAFFWAPVQMIHLFPWEESSGPHPPVSRLSAKERPDPDFPYRAMTEAEVRAFARGIAALATNAWLAREKEADLYGDEAEEEFYAAQAQNFETVLQLLRRVLESRYPEPGAN